MKAADLTECITEINEIVEKIKEGKKWSDPDWMSRAIVKLQSYNYTLGSFMSDLYTKTVDMETAVKVNQANEKLSIMRGENKEYTEAKTAAYADIVVPIITAELLDERDKADKAYKMVKFKVDHTNALVTAMQSSISRSRMG